MYALTWTTQRYDLCVYAIDTLHSIFNGSRNVRAAAASSRKNGMEINIKLNISCTRPRTSSSCIRICGPIVRFPKKSAKHFRRIKSRIEFPRITFLFSLSPMICLLKANVSRTSQMIIWHWNWCGENHSFLFLIFHDFGVGGSGIYAHFAEAIQKRHRAASIYLHVLFVWTVKAYQGPLAATQRCRGIEFASINRSLSEHKNQSSAFYFLLLFFLRNFISYNGGRIFEVAINWFIIYEFLFLTFSVHVRPERRKCSEEQTWFCVPWMAKQNFVSVSARTSSSSSNKKRSWQPGAQWKRQEEKSKRKETMSPAL